MTNKNLSIEHDDLELQLYTRIHVVMIHLHWFHCWFLFTFAFVLCRYPIVLRGCRMLVCCTQLLFTLYRCKVKDYRFIIIRQLCLLWEILPRIFCSWLHHASCPCHVWQITAWNLFDSPTSFSLRQTFRFDTSCLFY